MAATTQESSFVILTITSYLLLITFAKLSSAIIASDHVTVGDVMHLKCVVNEPGHVVFVIDHRKRPETINFCNTSVSPQETNRSFTATLDMCVPINMDVVQTACYFIDCGTEISQGENVLPQNASLISSKNVSVSGHVQDFNCIYEQCNGLQCRWSSNMSDIQFAYRFVKGGNTRTCPDPHPGVCSWPIHLHMVTLSETFSALLVRNTTRVCVVHHERVKSMNVFKFAPVSYIKSTSVTTHKLMVSWKLPDNCSWDYLTPKFQVSLTTSGYHTEEKNVTKQHCRFRRLHPYKNYTVSVRTIPQERISFASKAKEVVGYWSNAVTKVVQTDISVPAEAPQVFRQGFTVIKLPNDTRRVKIFFRQQKVDPHGPIDRIQLCYWPQDEYTECQFNHEPPSGTCKNFTGERVLNHWLNRGYIDSDRLLSNITYVFTLNSFTQKGMNKKLQLEKIIVMPDQELHWLREIERYFEVSLDKVNHELSYYWRPLKTHKRVIYTAHILYRNRWISLEGRNRTVTFPNIYETPEIITLSASYFLHQCPGERILVASGLMHYTDTVFDVNVTVLPPVSFEVSADGRQVTWSPDANGRVVGYFGINLNRTNSLAVHTEEIENDRTDAQSYAVPKELTVDAGDTISIYSIGVNGEFSETLTVPFSPEARWWNRWDLVFWLTIFVGLLLSIVMVGMFVTIKPWITRARDKYFEPIKVYLPPEEKFGGVCDVKIQTDGYDQLDQEDAKYTKTEKT